jgi:hypothetical protein
MTQACSTNSQRYTLNQSYNTPFNSIEIILHHISDKHTFLIITNLGRASLQTISQISSQIHASSIGCGCPCFPLLFLIDVHAFLCLRPADVCDLFFCSSRITSKNLEQSHSLQLRNFRSFIFVLDHFTQICQ